MHIDNDKLVGTYVSDIYSEKGTVTIVLTDGDSTPTREYTRYKYVQTEQLTAIGVAVKDYGVFLVPETVFTLFLNGTLNPSDFGVFVKFNEKYYSISVAEMLTKVISDTVEFVESTFDDYPNVTFNSTLPPFSSSNNKQVPTVVEGEVKWANLPKATHTVLITGNNPFESEDTYDSIMGYINNGVNVIAKWSTQYFNLAYITSTVIYFDNFDVNADNQVVRNVFVFKTDRTIRFDTYVKYAGPTVIGNANKVLKVNAAGNGTEWGDVPNELPTIGSGDAGKVLKVNAGETGVEWGAASGGGQLYRHKIKLEKPSIINSFTVTVISTDATAYNESGFISYLTNHGAINANKALPVDANCSYRSNLTNMVKIVTGVYADSNLIYTYTHNISVSNGEITDSASTATVSFVEDVCEAL